MNRRHFLKKALESAAAISVTPARRSATPSHALADTTLRYPARRVRPEDSAWPSAANWDQLRRNLKGDLIKLQAPFVACKSHADNESCAELLKKLKNPYFIGDEPALTQTSGWLSGWRSAPSAYAVAARNTQDIVAAVNFAREKNLRLVVKGGGHSYQGTSNAPDSLLIWTRRMNGITLHNAFVGRGCEGIQAPRQAVTVEAGAIWMHVYDAVTTQAGRYVQGGGCTTVGVAGLIQSGGFGSFSKNYGLAAAGLIEAEIVTADGAVRTANACLNPDLFWGIKGGGGGSLGVVTKLTLRTRELPARFGGVFGMIKARSDSAFRRLIAKIMGFYKDALFNRHWGEQLIFQPDNVLKIAMVFQGLDRRSANNVWQPLLNWIAGSPHDFSIETPMEFVDIPARHFWDAAYLKQNYPDFVVADDRPDTPAGNVFWKGDQGEVGQFLHGYRSVWLPASLLNKDGQSALTDALFASSRHWGVSLHFNKGLAGASAEDLATARDTAINPAVLDAFALAIIASGGPPAFPGLPDHEPDLTAARRQARDVDNAMNEILKVVPNPGSYVAESNFYEPDWQRSFWGSNYSRLAAVKQKYDPDGLFFVRHGVGSEKWSADGFTRLFR